MVLAEINYSGSIVGQYSALLLEIRQVRCT